MAELPVDAVWDRVCLHLRNLSDYARAKRPGVNAQIDRHRNDYFPLRAALSLSTGGPSADEDLVASVDIHRSGSTYRCTADLALGNGLIVVDGPSVELNDSDIAARIAEALDAWLRDLGEFLDSEGRKAIDQHVPAKTRLRARVSRVAGTTRSVEIRPGDAGFYLLCLDEQGECHADTWHQTVEEAKAQALFEFGINDGDWGENGAA